MREPAFWHRPSSWVSRMLWPVGALYGAVAARRMQGKGIDAGIPVLCVGNYHVGGAGKTPVVLALTTVLRDLGENPIVLSRGYGGRLHGPLTVDPDRHEASDVGDEPVMLARTVAVVVSRDRVGGLALAKSHGASVIVMDDGFQNPAIAKDASVIVIDANRGVGNGYVLPAGPLRAPLPPQLANTDALIVVGDGAAARSIAAAIASKGSPVFSAHLKPDHNSLAALNGKRVLAFAGIGDPSRFFRTLRGNGVEIGHERAFPDHHRFSGTEIEMLLEEAANRALTLVTTEKDLARVRTRQGLPAWAKDIVPFGVTLEFERADELRQFVSGRLFQVRQSRFSSE